MPKAAKEITKLNKVLERLEVEHVAIDSLQPNSYNPNRQGKGDFDLLLASMREDGFTQPIVALRATRKIVDGEHRWRAAGALDMTTVPVVFVDMSEEQARISTLRHNRARGSEDMELAAEVLRDLERLGALDWAQDSLMLDDAELERLLKDVPASEAFGMSEDFSDAWDPIQTGGAVDHATGDELKRETDDGTSSVTLTASTPTALSAMRDREQALAKARTTEERATIQREMRSFWRVSLLFDGEDAALAKAVLNASDSPAEMLLGLIRHGIATGFIADPTVVAAAAEIAG